MSNFDSDGGSENQWEDRGDLAWNEFDWERYLREQDEAIHRYLRFYESCKGSIDRIDQVAEKMNWAQDDWSDEGDTEGFEDSDDDESESDDQEEAEPGRPHANLQPRPPHHDRVEQQPPLAGRGDQLGREDPGAD